MLSPEEYGVYLAVGESGHSRGQAIFFEVDPNRVGEIFALEEARQRCRPDAAGNPKNSVYLGIYRILERMPLEALGALYLITDDGRCLRLDKAALPETEAGEMFLYQEFVPVKPRVLSCLDPAGFARHLCQPERLVYLPRLVFADLLLPPPDSTDPGNLPYPDLPHLRDCMEKMKRDPEKNTKLISRMFRGEVQYRTIRHGFYVGDAETLLHYPMPSLEELEKDHYAWWRSAQTVHMT